MVCQVIEASCRFCCRRAGDLEERTQGGQRSKTLKILSEVCLPVRVFLHLFKRLSMVLHAERDTGCGNSFLFMFDQTIILLLNRSPDHE